MARIQIYNPSGRRRKTGKRRTAKANPLGELTYMFNPSRRRKSGKRRSASRRARPNPGRRRSGRRSMFMRGNRRRNPSGLRDRAARAGLPVTISQWGELGIGAVAGSLGSGWVTNFAGSWGMGGFVSYLIQAGVSIFGGIGIAKYFNRFMGVGFAAGGLGAVVVRAIQENNPSHPVAIAQAAGAQGASAAVVPALPPGADSTLSGLGTFTPFQYSYPSTNQWVGGNGSGLGPAGPGAQVLPTPALGSGLPVARDQRY